MTDQDALQGIGDEYVEDMDEEGIFESNFEQEEEEEEEEEEEAEGATENMNEEEGVQGDDEGEEEAIEGEEDGEGEYEWWVEEWEVVGDDENEWVQADAAAPEAEEFGRHNKKDVTAADVCKGKDLQGIPWKAPANTSRQSLRTARKVSRDLDPGIYEETPVGKEILDKEKRIVKNGKLFYKFTYNSRTTINSYTHPQLRHLLFATSKQDLYYTNDNRIFHYCPQTVTSKLLLDLSGRAKAPPAIIPSTIPADFLEYRRVLLCTMYVNPEYAIAGGHQGELVIYKQETGELLYNDRISLDDNAITNGIELNSRSTSGDVRLICSNNDGIIRTFHLPTMNTISRFYYNYCINYSSLSPDQRLLCVVGDSTDSLIVDSQSGQTIATLKGHLDFGFAAAWHPSGRLVATGNQDRTIRLWDIRFPSACYGLLTGEMAAVRSIRFSNNGKYMAAAETVDFVQVFDVDADYSTCQQIDLFGQISGICFSPCSEFLFVSNADPNYGGIMEYCLNRPDVPIL